MGQFQPTIPDSDLTTAFSTEVLPLGTLYQDDDGLMYRFVKVVDAIDLTIGMSVAPSTEGLWHVTADRYGGTSLFKQITALTSFFIPTAGIALGTVDMSETPYVWIQVGGLCASVLTDGTFAANELVIAAYAADATKDGIATLANYETDLTPQENTFGAFGVAYEADTGTTGSCYLHNCWFRA